MDYGLKLRHTTVSPLASHARSVVGHLTHHPRAHARGSALVYYYRRGETSLRRSPRCSPFSTPHLRKQQGISALSFAASSRTHSKPTCSHRPRLSRPAPAGSAQTNFTTPPRPSYASAIVRRCSWRWVKSADLLQLPKQEACFILDISLWNRFKQVP